MQIASLRFTPRLWALALYLVVLACMLWLGNWQLDRAALKVTLQQAAENSLTVDAVALQSVDDVDEAAAMYKRVSLAGKYYPEKQFLWDNRTYKGQAGYEVISPILLDNGAVALVNRGWVAPGPSRLQLPDISLPVTVADASITIEGYLSQPSKGFASGDAVTGVDRWPRLLQFFDYDAIGQTLGERVIPAVVQPQTLGVDAISTTVLTPRPEWLAANWQPAASGPAKHYSYAFQWFAMALALTGLFLFVNTSRLDPAAGEKDSADLS